MTSPQFKKKIGKIVVDINWHIRYAIARHKLVECSVFNQLQFGHNWKKSKDVQGKEKEYTKKICKEYIKKICIRGGANKTKMASEFSDQFN